MLIQEIVDCVHDPIAPEVPIRIKLVLVLSVFLVYALFVRWWSLLFLRCLVYEREPLVNREREGSMAVLGHPTGKQEEIEVMEKPYTDLTTREKLFNTDHVLFYRLVCDN